MARHPLRLVRSCHFARSAVAASAVLCLTALSSPAAPTTSPATPLAFPGAVGFGAHATGGRGAEVVHVSNLDDAGPGSFREAVGHSHRNVVFDVGGYVQLKKPLSVASDITIAGQTAPGDGVGTMGAEVSFSGSKNIICRYIRFRQGLASGENKKSAVGMHDAHNVILDHVSIQFGRWDTVDMTGSSDVTIQYSIIGPGVAPQRFGCLCESDGVTFSHDLWINNHSRNPKSKGKVQFINNVVYNWELDAYIAGASAGKNWHDVIGNYFIAGPDSKHGPFARGNENTQIYAKDNYYDDDRNGALDGKPVPDSELGPVTLLNAPFSEATAAPDTPEEAYRKIVAGAGCSLHRDSVDQQLIDDLTSLGKKGKIISDPEEMGGFGELKGGPTPKTSDADGIPDDWKSAHGPTDRSTSAADGYTMLETYFNSMVPAHP